MVTSDRAESFLQFEGSASYEGEGRKLLPMPDM